MAFLRPLQRPAMACIRQCTSSQSSIFAPSRRTFTSLLAPSIRPQISSTPACVRPTTLPLQPQTSTSPSSSLLPSSLIQTRGHRRKTYNPSHLVRKRRFGFLARLRSKTGKNILKRRKLKGRKILTH